MRDCSFCRCLAIEIVGGILVCETHLVEDERPCLACAKVATCHHDYDRFGLCGLCGHDDAAWGYSYFLADGDDSPESYDTLPEAEAAARALARTVGRTIEIHFVDPDGAFEVVRTIEA